MHLTPLAPTVPLIGPVTSLARHQRVLKIYRGTAPPPPIPPVSKLDRRHAGRLRKRDNLLPWEGEGGWARVRIIRLRESIVLYKSFNTLWPGRHSTGLKINGSKLRKLHLVKPFSSTFKNFWKKNLAWQIYLFFSEQRWLVNVEKCRLPFSQLLFLPEYWTLDALLSVINFQFHAGLEK
jgi:hypothetical protein